MKKRYNERDMRLDAEAQHIFFDSFAQLKRNTLTKKIWAPPSPSILFSMPIEKNEGGIQ